MFQTTALNKFLFLSMPFLLVLFLTSTVFAEVPASTLDSLWIRASSGAIRFTEDVQPCKDALVEYGEETIDFLADKMDTRSAREMHTIVDVLGKIGNAATQKVCGQLESDDDFRVRLACRVLGEIKDSTAVDCLLPHARDNLYNIRSGVASALGKIEHPSATGTLKKLAHDNDYLVRKSATAALGKMAFDPVKNDLIKNLSDEYYGVRYSAADALIGFGDQTVSILIEFVREHIKSVKLINKQLGAKETRFSSDYTFSVALAIDCLGKIGDKKANNILKKVINSSRNPLIRGYAARALGKTGGKSNYKFLIKRQQVEKDPFVRALMVIGAELALIK